MYRQIVFLILLSSLATALSRAECNELSRGSPEGTLVSFLQRSRDLPTKDRDPDCITVALRGLEDRVTAQYAELLISYLDFERPLDDKEERAGWRWHGRLMIGDKYPATGPLMTMGEAALTPLLGAIRDSNSAIVRYNATYTVMQIFRDDFPRGVRFLSDAAKQTAGDSLLRLQQSANDAVEMCRKSDRDECNSIRDDYR